MLCNLAGSDNLKAITWITFVLSKRNAKPSSADLTTDSIHAGATKYKLTGIFYRSH